MYEQSLVAMRVADDIAVYSAVTVTDGSTDMRSLLRTRLQSSVSFDVHLGLLLTIVGRT